MELLVSEVISEVVNDLRLLGIDEYISKRYVHFKLKAFNSILIKRDSDSRKLFQQLDLFTTIDCLKMEPADPAVCCDIAIPTCNIVSRSVKKLKDLVTTAYGPIVIVSSVDESTFFIYSSPAKYKSINSSRYKNGKNRYFWISDDRIVIPDSEIEAVKVRVLASDPNGILDECSRDMKGCNPVLENKFVSPDYLYAAVRQETVKDLFSFYKRVQVDENPDGNELKKTQ